MVELSYLRESIEVCNLIECYSVFVFKMSIIVDKLSIFEK